MSYSRIIKIFLYYWLIPVLWVFISALGDLTKKLNLVSSSPIKSGNSRPNFLIIFSYTSVLGCLIFFSALTLNLVDAKLFPALINSYSCISSMSILVTWGHYKWESLILSLMWLKNSIKAFAMKSSSSLSCSRTYKNAQTKSCKLISLFS